MALTPAARQGRPGAPDPPAAPPERPPRADRLRAGPRRRADRRAGPRVHRRSRRALERQRRPRPHRAGGRGGGADGGARLLLGLFGLVEHPGHPARGKLWTIAYHNMQGGLLHLGRRGVQRVRLQDRALLLEGPGQARQGEDHRARTGLPRRDAAGDERHRHGALLEDVRAARAGLRAHPDLLSVSSGGPKPGETAGQAAARLLEEAILREGADTVAAFIAEPIHGGGGVLYPTDDYFPLVRQSATSTRCSSSPTRSSPASAAPAAGSRSRTGTCRPTSCPSPRASPPGICRWRHHGLEGDQGGHGRREARGRWMHAYTYSGIRPAARSGSRTSRSWSASGSGSARRPWAPAPRASSTRCGDHKHVATSAAARGCSPPSSSWRTAPTKATSAPTRSSGQLLAEMTKRGVITRARLEHIFFAPPLVVSEAQVDRLVSVTHDADQGRHRRPSASILSSLSPSKGDGRVRGSGLGTASPRHHPQIERVGPLIARHLHRPRGA